MYLPYRVGWSSKIYEPSLAPLAADQKSYGWSNANERNFKPHMQNKIHGWLQWEWQISPDALITLLELVSNELHLQPRLGIIVLTSVASSKWVSTSDYHSILKAWTNHTSRSFSHIFTLAKMFSRRDLWPQMGCKPPLIGPKSINTQNRWIIVGWMQLVGIFMHIAYGWCSAHPFSIISQMLPSMHG